MRRMIVATLLFTIGCESNEAKYARLNQELLVAQLAVGNVEWAQKNNKPLCPELSSLPTDAYVTACERKVEEQRARLALAQREMNKFMSGR